MAAAIAARKGEHTIGAYSTPATVIAAAAGAFSTSATVTAESAGRGSPANMAQGEVQAAAEVQAETLVKQDGHARPIQARVQEAIPFVSACLQLLCCNNCCNLCVAAAIP